MTYTKTQIIKMAKFIEEQAFNFCDTDGCIESEKLAKILYLAGYRNGQTCKNNTDNDPHDEFICSNCSFEMSDFAEQETDLDDGEKTYHEFEIRYCPNCGAKVVDNE